VEPGAYEYHREGLQRGATTVTPRGGPRVTETAPPRDDDDDERSDAPERGYREYRNERPDTDEVDDGRLGDPAEERTE
jgi:hypothetical protein